jgi:hypothetical protein
VEPDLAGQPRLRRRPGQGLVLDPGRGGTPGRGRAPAGRAANRAGRGRRAAVRERGPAGAGGARPAALGAGWRSWTSRSAAWSARCATPC